jgi:hypothetical protein
LIPLLQFESNLIHRLSATSLDNTSAKLISLLQSWAALRQEVYPSEDELVEWLPIDLVNGCPRALLYILDHKYTSAAFSFSRLKGLAKGLGSLESTQKNRLFSLLGQYRKD